jgi:Arc/MetJ family transcription regulator
LYRNGLKRVLDAHPRLLWHMMCHMRTTLELDDALMDALLARNPGSTKREAVERAIRAYLAADATERIRALRGRIDVEDVSRELRRDRST